MGVYQKLMFVQSGLKAPKNQFNSFGKYNYRSCEDILEGLKPLLNEIGAVVTLQDKIVQIGDRYYLEATATFSDIESTEKVQTTALAREDETKKGMDLAQVTGSVSSYARKYALNGLFCIDDTKDSDATNAHGKGKETTEKKGVLNEAQVKRLYAIAFAAGFDKNKVKEHMIKKYNIESTDQLTKTQYDEMCNGYQKVKKIV